MEEKIIDKFISLHKELDEIEREYPEEACEGMTRYMKERYGTSDVDEMLRRLQADNE